MRTVFINDQPVKLASTELIGEGGEAEIFRLNSDTALKLFKTPDYPQYKRDGTARLVAQRLDEYQSKLQQFPKVFAQNVVTPQDCAFSNPGGTGRVAGYTMPLISPACSLREYSQRDFREKGGISSKDVIELFIEIHRTVSQLHRQSIVIGDFNQFNVLIKGNYPYLIDADSMQFGTFRCRSFSPRYTDPLNLQRTHDALAMVQNHSQESDWYSFAVLLFECLLYVHPYGGVYKSSEPQQRLSTDERILKRVSVFQPSVKYPSAGEPISSLPQQLQDYFYELLVRDARQPIPMEILESIIRKPVATISGNGSATPSQTPTSKATRLFHTDGVILTSEYDGNQLRYLYFSDGQFYREDGRAILRGTLDPALRFALFGSKTLCGKDNRIYILDGEKSVERLNVELFRGLLPVFAANEKNCFFVDQGQLFCYADGTTRLIEEVLANQTRIWTGQEFGFGLILAGDFKRPFLFDSNPGRTLIEEELFSGAPLDFRCRFSKNRVWLLSTTKNAGRIYNRCSLLDRRGRLLATREEPEGTGGWQDFQESSCAATLPTIGSQTTEVLLVATNGGIATIAEASGRLEIVKQISEIRAESLDCSQLLYTQFGLHLCSTKTISRFNSMSLIP